MVYLLLKGIMSSCNDMVILLGWKKNQLFAIEIDIF